MWISAYGLNLLIFHMVETGFGHSVSNIEMDNASSNYMQSLSKKLNCLQLIFLVILCKMCFWMALLHLTMFCSSKHWMSDHVIVRYKHFSAILNVYLLYWKKYLKWHFCGVKQLFQFQNWVTVFIKMVVMWTFTFVKNTQ